MKIAIINPDWYHFGEKYNYLSSRFFFVQNNCNALFFTKKKFFFRWIYNCLKTRTPISEILTNKKVVFKYSKINSNYDILIQFNNPPLNYIEFLKNIKIPKLVALFDYNYNTRVLSEKLKEINIRHIIGHTRHDLFDPYFKYFFKKNKFEIVFDYPFGFNNNKNLKNRIDKIVGLGAISRFDRSTEINQLHDYYSFMKDSGRNYSHLDRLWFRNNSDSITDCFHSYLPSDKVRRNLSFKESTLLPKYSFFLNDLGSLNFLPARFFEGIGFSVIPFAKKHSIYEYYGFNEFNMVFFTKNNINEIRKNFNEALENKENLISNIELIKTKFNYDNINNNLYENIRKNIN